MGKNCGDPEVYYHNAIARCACFVFRHELRLRVFAPKTKPKPNHKEEEKQAQARNCVVVVYFRIAPLGAQI